MSTVNSSLSPAQLGGGAMSPASLSTTGGRRRMSRKLRATKKKLLKLKKQIKRLGGAEEDVGGLDQAAAGLATAAKNVGGADLEAPMTDGGRRRSRKTRRGRKSRRALFGLRY